MNHSENLVFIDTSIELRTMVFMNTQKDNANNMRLRQLIEEAGLTQLDALALFNRKLRVRKLAESSWKAYFCQPDKTRYRWFNDEYLQLAETVFKNTKKKIDR